ncbi:MAG: hypothetical protein Q7R45_03885 [Sulfuricaulis sp.]|nr:hypothetical protein [Sulfuricaulis sp.]
MIIEFTVESGFQRRAETRAPGSTRAIGLAGTTAGETLRGMHSIPLTQK